MIRYLEKSEFGACRPLWQEAFPEDSREFADYYFDKKLCQSAVLAVSYTHLTLPTTPYV